MRTLAASGTLERARGFLLQATRYGLVGILNTAVGFAIIALLDVGLGVNPHIANAAGYGVGVVLSYSLNRVFVFKSNASARASAPRFLAAVAVAFAINQGMLSVASHFLGGAPGARLASQALANISYTVSLFLLCRGWVFRAPAA